MNGEADLRAEPAAAGADKPQAKNRSVAVWSGAT